MIAKHLCRRAARSAARWWAPVPFVAYVTLQLLAGGKWPLFRSLTLDFLYVFGGAVIGFAIGFLVFLPICWLCSRTRGYQRDHSAREPIQITARQITSR